ncbi:hypothetical protein HPB47_016681 [Ixodes persulcatus]|uniref:Uncharacterized protein n=1 Tax=Ixodes persulcatus TaxID=34615 RepID=A0AC60QQ89_IXOPE|nr:hypothetical protein HPB47_016681 [Ixodes persulcatus]
MTSLAGLLLVPGIAPRQPTGMIHASERRGDVTKGPPFNVEGALLAGYDDDEPGQGLRHPHAASALPLSWVLRRPELVRLTRGDR